MSNNDSKKGMTINKMAIALDSISLLAIIVIIYFLYTFSSEIAIIKESALSSNEKLTQKISIIETDLATTTSVSKELAQKIIDQQDKSNSLQSSISNITGTVSVLEKLSKTDKEILQKYSKVYFLSDNYVPISLASIDTKYIYDTTKQMQFHTTVLPFLTRMIDQAGYENISLKIVSAYRSFGAQSSLKNTYLTTYGSGANKFSADQGYSEHQLGTAIDITTVNLETPLTINFKDTKAYEWLTKNAYKYGFILSYPENNTHYEYEPWHWRFVGVGLATQLHNTNMKFTDMEQREIDKYLVYIFD